MAIPQSATILHHLRHSVLRQGGAGLSDGQLLRSFLYRGDEAAFEALVRRHGPMVRGVCRRVLRNAHDADDAFQAAFLVLVRKASSLATREILGDWLHGVAYRTALKARTAAARRRWKEQQALRCEAIADEPDRSDWLPLLDQEIGRLPPKYRQPVVLCDLEGRTRKEAAEYLGWPEGTLSGRLSRARAMLARRLIRRGVTLSTAAVTAGLASDASARVPFSLVGSTCKAAMGSVSGHVAALTEGVVQAMFVAKLKKSIAVLSAILLLTAGIGAWRYAAEAGQTEEQQKQPSQPAIKVLPKGPGEPRDQARILPIPSGNRSFRIDLRLTKVTDGQRKALALPRVTTLDGREATFAMGPDNVLTINGTQFERFLMGPSVRVKVCSSGQGKFCLVITVNQPTLGTFDQEVTVESRSIHALRWIELGKPITVKLQTSDKDQNFLEVAAAVQEADKAAGIDSDVDVFLDVDTIRRGNSPYSEPPPPSEQEKKEFEAKRIAAAAKDFKIAEFYRKTGHPDSARFYYELIRERYPNTEFAKRAAKRLDEVKEPARVGQIFLLGNKKISDEKILKEVGLFPGQILTYPDLDIAERKLAQLKGLKSAQVRVIDRVGDNTFKDLQITVEEK